MSGKTRDLYGLEASAAECAAFLKLAERRFHKLAEAGAITGRKERGVYILGEVAESYYKSKYSTDANSIKAAKLRKELAAAELKELDLAQRKGELVSVDEVEKQVGNMILNARGKLLALPMKLAAQLAHITDVNLIQDLLKSGISGALNELAAGE